MEQHSLRFLFIHLMRNVPEPQVGSKITARAEVLGRGDYSPTAFDALIEHIEVPKDNHLRFIFKDSSVVERTWTDRSRRESWTPEMRQAAAERTRSQRGKTQCQE